MDDAAEQTAPPSGFVLWHWTTPIFIWLAVSLVFILSHFSFYFLKPHYEGGDFAANALQIRQAKGFHELHGNYSRFGFHHPGPAFFYAYALGETILFDALKIVPAPYNAHAITGILIQAFFFAWALSIVAKRIRRPLLVPLILFFAAVHFGIVNFNLPDSAFESIWPPYVLLFPFLCFLIAAASVASGDVNDLIPLVLSGCMLVHGHVAQPLFVLPLFSIVYAALCLGFFRWKQTFNSTPFRNAPYTHLCAAGIVALFLLPLILDACKGDESNLRSIIGYLRQPSHDHKSLSQSLVYLAAFFYYLGNPEKYCDPINFSNLTFLVDRSLFLWMWILIAIVILVPPTLALPDERRFFRWLLALFALALPLTLVWGTLQDKEMFAFNACFNFSLLFVPFILLAIALSSFDDHKWSNWLRPLLFTAAILLGIMAARNWSWQSDLPSEPTGTQAMVDKVRQAALDDGQGSKTKFLSFEHDTWDWAAGVALALERFGYGYAIPPQWTFIFGSKHAANLPESLRRGEVALWTVKSPAVAGENWISNSVPQIDPAQAEITFSGAEANAQAFVIEGWDVSTGSFSWSTQKTALLYFRASPASHDVQIDFEVFPYNFSTAGVQHMAIIFNNESPKSFEVTQEGVYSLQVPAAVWNSRGGSTLAFEFPDAISSKDVGESGDERWLGCKFIRIDFRFSPKPVPALSR